MWDLIVSVPDNCLSFYFSMGISHHFHFRGSPTPNIALIKPKAIYSKFKRIDMKIGIVNLTHNLKC